MEYPPTLSGQDAKTLIYGADKKIGAGKNRSNLRPKRQHWVCKGCGAHIGGSMSSCPICQARRERRLPENPENPGCWGTPEAIPYKEPKWLFVMERIAWTSLVLIGIFVAWIIVGYIF